MPFSATELSYGLLWMLTAVASLLLQQALAEVLQAGDQLERSRPIERLPDFTLPVCGSSRSLTRRDAIGTQSTFVFVGAEGQTSEIQERLLTSLHLFTQRTPKVYLVAGGASNLNQASPFDAVPGVLTLVDAEGQLARQCKVRQTPAAVVFDADGRYLKSGRMGYNDVREER